MKNIKFIPIQIHGLLDYLVDVVLILTPVIFNFQDKSDLAFYLPIAIGLFNLLYSLSTNYQMGLFKFLSFKGHLALDFLVGIPLILGSIMIRLNSLPGFFCLLMGIGIILAVLFTKSN